MTYSGTTFTRLLSVVALDERPTEDKTLGNQVVNLRIAIVINITTRAVRKDFLFETVLDCL